MTQIRQGLTFDDVLLIPKHSDLKSRSEVDMGVDLGKGIRLSMPIISANMKSVSEQRMADAMHGLGGLAILHRFMDIKENVAMWRRCKHAGASIGVKKEDLERLEALTAAGCRIICVDVAHGDSDACVRMVEEVHKRHPEVLLIAGNVATADGALRLHKAGADVIKVGIGPGSLCTTRIETGHGVPQLTALMDVHEARRSSGAKFTVIADGGIKAAGDIVKALCFSEAVMIGNLLAGTEEAPGEIVAVNEQRYKQYNGSSTHKANHVEGVSTLVQYKGNAEHIITKLMEGVRSGCSYQGAHSILDLQKDPNFIMISHAGLAESHPHVTRR
jgi:IMP dehydrogenase